MTRIFCVLLVLLPATSAASDEWLSGTWVRAARKFDRAIEETRASGDVTSEARLLAARAHFLLDRSSYHRRDFEGSRRAIEQARTAAEASEDGPALASAIHAWGRWQYWQKLLRGAGEWDAIDATFLEALRIREQIGDRGALSDSWFYLGLVRQMQRDLAPAREAFERSLALADDPLARSFPLRHLGFLMEASGDPASARSSYEESLALRREAGAHALVAFALNLVADFELETAKDAGRARALLHESTRTARCAGSWRALHAAETRLAQLESEQGRVARARDHAVRALEAARKYGDPALIAEASKAADALAAVTR